MTTLAFDMSSTSIGWVAWNDSAALAHGTVNLGNRPLALRLVLAEIAIVNLLERYEPARVAFEGGAKGSRHVNTVQALQRAAGVLVLCATRLGVPTVEIAPAQGKKALTGKGKSDKDQMLAFASKYLIGAFDEHAADAVGIALASEQPPKEKKPRKRVVA
jgi:Holliday junction resolvasome RuvABC endonuclease subunit